MSAITRFTLKSLRANRVRTLVTIAGVALAAALFTAVMTSYTSLNGYLYESEKMSSGDWMASVHVSDLEEADEDIANARDDAEVAGLGVITDVGYAELSNAQQQTLGTYLPIGTYSGDLEELCAIRPVIGRCPASPSEIMLPELWVDRAYAEIGSTLHLNVGQRMAVAADAEHDTMTSNSAPLGYKSEGITSEIADGTILDSTIGYLRATEDDGYFNEKLVDVEPMTFTVVGFCSTYNYALSCGVGQMALIGYGEGMTGPSTIYATYTGMKTTAQVEELTDSLFPGNNGTVYNVSLLRYLGIRGDSPLWDTFFGLVGLLSTIIAVACVSLIYNAFAISVAERTSQFGLLASIGASKRQLRRSVFLEGLLVAVIGIPLGLLIGVGGCAITFHFLGPTIASLISSDDLPFNTVIAPGALILAASLTFATVIVSVLIPALRASRLSPVESIRQSQTGTLSKRSIKSALKATDPDKLWKTHGVLARFFGIGGVLARKNSKRSKTKGRAASLSLALAIVLLMTAGSLDLFIKDLIFAANTSTAYDIGLALSLEDDDPGVSGSEGEARSSGLTANEIEYYEQAYLAAGRAPGAQGEGWFLAGSVPMVASADMVSPDMVDSDGLRGEGALRHDGTWGSMASMYFLEDSLFDSYAQSMGIDPSGYYDSENPKVIAVDSTYSLSNGKYEKLSTFTNTGSLALLKPGEFMGMDVRGYEIYQWRAEDDESPRFEFVPVAYEEDPDSGVSMPILDDTITSKVQDGLVLADLPQEQVTIGALADETPSVISQHTDSLQLIAPVSLALGGKIPAEPLSYTGAFNVIDLPHAEVATNIEEAFTKFNYEYSASNDLELSYYLVIDHEEDRDSSRSIALVVNVFCLLFTVILTLIALANVFNTITNGMILRRREFAVMKSIGMSNGQFRSMIVDECLGYSVRGLIPGLIVSLVVSYVFYMLIGISMSGMSFTLPWGYLAIAICLILVAMLVSVAYGIHRCKSDNAIDSLRSQCV